MKKGYVILIAVAAVLVVLCGTCIGQRNAIVSADQEVKAQWGNVESNYQRRLDLIPNLVNTVKGYSKHESETLQSVTDARVGLKKAYDNASAQIDSAGVPDASQIERIQQSQNELMRQASIYVNAVHEAYPDLKANQNFLDLQEELAGTENRINTSRINYNEAVQVFNNKILRFPGSIFAWGYTEKSMFKAEAGASKAPTVDFGTGDAKPDVDF